MDVPPPPRRPRFFEQPRIAARPDGGLLIGVDLPKPASRLRAAYDDALGVTAAFDLNVLRHVNRLLGADFDVTEWRHLACVDDACSRVEMHLQARRPVTVRWAGGERRFAEGERIHTENACRHSPQAFAWLLAEAGFEPTGTWTDPRGEFAVFHAVPAD